MRHMSEVLERGGSGTDRRQADQHIFDGILEGAGPHLTTFRGGAAHAIRPPGAYTFRANHHFISVALTPVPRMQAARGSDAVQEFDAPVGMLALAPANEDHYVAWPSARENVVVAITPENLREVAAREFDTGDAELKPPPFGTVDPPAFQLAQLLKAELTQRATPNELYVDSLVTVFGVHILRNYAGVRKSLPRPRGGLSVQSARRVQEFLEVNFSRKLSVPEIAAVSGLSPRHFIEAFTKTFGEPPHKHVLGLRLDFATRLLVKGDLPIAEIAHLSGFSSQSHLTGMMMKHRKTTPMQVRRAR